jgi:hypothetical protein
MIKIMVKIILLASFLILIPLNLHPQECQNYTAAHPDWVLCEDWETGNIRSSIWNDVSGTNTIISSDKYSGNYALQMTHAVDGTGGYMNSIGFPPQYNGPLGNGYKKLFLRWYIKFSSNFSVNSKIAGYDIRPDGLTSFWDYRLGAGYRPNGITSLGGSRIVNGPGPIEFYTYYPYMMVDRWTDDSSTLHCGYYGDARPLPDGWHIGTPGTEYPEDDYYCQPPGTSAWNEFGTLLNQADNTYSGTREIGRETWRCIEFELKVNDPGQINGYQRLYLDNTQVGEWSGITWTLQDVDGKIRNIQLTASSPEDAAHPLIYSYYDNIVASTSRIGCLGSDVPETDPEPEPDTGIKNNLDNPDDGIRISSGCGFVQFQWHFSYSILVIILAALALVIIERDKSRKA